MKMKIVYHRRFNKQLAKLERHEKLAVAEAIELFAQAPFDSRLRNHPLKGDMTGQRSISAGYDLRIIFEEQDGYMIVLMLAVGTHEEVY